MSNSPRRLNSDRKAQNPHIYFYEGYWRVSPMSKPYSKVRNQVAWHVAHRFVSKKNEELRTCGR